MNNVLDIFSGMGRVVQGAATICDAIADQNGPKKNCATLFYSVIDATNLCLTTPTCVVASKFLKGVAEVAGAFESVGTLTNIVTAKTATDSPIVIGGDRYPNPITLTASLCMLVSQTGGTIKFFSSMDYLDIGNLAKSAGSVPYFGWALEAGLKDLPVVRTTFGIVGIILNLCDNFRQMAEGGCNWKIVLAVVSLGGKFVFIVFIDTQIGVIKFLANVANATSATASLLGILAK